MERITYKDLVQAVDGLNTRLHRVDDVGKFGLNGAYGGWQLVEYMEHGGIRSISSGFRSKPDMMDFIRGVQVGISLSENSKGVSHA